MKAYYKGTMRKYQDYTLPTMTSVSSPAGFVEYDVNVTGNGSQLYPMFFSGSSVTIDCYRSNTSTSRYIKYTFEKLLDKGKYIFKYAGSKQQNVTMTQNRWIVIYEDNTSTEIMSNLFTDTAQTFSVTFTAEKPIKAIQLNITATSSNVNYCNMVITNVSLTTDGYDTNNVRVYEDVEVYKVPKINEKYYGIGG